MKVTVDDGHGNTVSASATVTCASSTDAVRNVPTGVGVYLNSGHDTGNSWTCAASDSNPCKLTGATTRTPMLMPDRDAVYTLTEGTNSMKITSQ